MHGSENWSPLYPSFLLLCNNDYSKSCDLKNPIYHLLSSYLFILLFPYYSNYIHIVTFEKLFSIITLTGVCLQRKGKRIRHESTRKRSMKAKCNSCSTFDHCLKKAWSVKMWLYQARKNSSILSRLMLSSFFLFLTTTSLQVTCERAENKVASTVASLAVLFFALPILVWKDWLYF